MTHLPRFPPYFVSTRHTITTPRLQPSGDTVFDLDATEFSQAFSL